MAEEYDELELSRLRENALKSRPAQHHHVSVGGARPLSRYTIVKRIFCEVLIL